MTLSTKLPILLIGYNRPDLLQARLKEIDHLPIPILYICVDSTPAGPNPGIVGAINEFQSLNHKFEVSVIIQDQNLGLTKHVTQSISKVLEKEDSVFVVEDDIQINQVSYSAMCAGLDYLMELGKTGVVGGFSPLRKPEKKVKNYWRTTGYFSVWGWVATRENWKNYDYDLSKVDLSKALAKSKVWKNLTKFQKSAWLSRFERAQKDPLYTWDIQMQFWSFVQDFTNLLPLYRVVENLGFDDSRATHTQGAKPRWFRIAEPTLFCKPVKRLVKPLEQVMKVIDSNTLFGDAWLFHFYSRKIRPLIKS